MRDRLPVHPPRPPNTPSMPLPQEAWVKDNRAAASLVMATGERGLTLLSEMQRLAKVTAGGLRCLEAVVVPADYHRIVSLMDPDVAKPTAQRLKAVTNDVLMERWWRWCLLHPLLDATRVHPTRSVFPCRRPLLLPQHPLLLLVMAQMRQGSTL